MARGVKVWSLLGQPRLATFSGLWGFSLDIYLEPKRGGDALMVVSGLLRVGSLMMVFGRGIFDLG